MRWLRGAVGLVALLALGAALASGGSRTDSTRQSYLPAGNALRTISRFGGVRTVTIRSLGDPDAVRVDPPWLARARPLGPGAPRWAKRMYRRSLLVLRAMMDPRTGAVVAGRRDGWEYVWPRDAGAVAMALASAGYRDEARQVVSFLHGLDLSAAARFHQNGTPVEGRAAQGDADGWVDAAARVVGLDAHVAPQSWRDRADYQESEAGDYLGNAIATAGEPKGIPAGAPSVRRPAEEEIRREFGAKGRLVREADDPESGIDTAAAWAVRPFRLPALFPLARRTLLRIAVGSGRYGIVPSENWDGGIDPWTAPTAWTAWSLAALGERRAALHLMVALRRDQTPAGLLPERVDAHTGVPTSTTPLAWSHAFAILAIRELWA